MLTRTNPTKAHSLPGSGRGWLITLCANSEYLQSGYTNQDMASSSTKRQILQYDSDLMEVDTPAQKRGTD
jgi:hypothetical protein